MTDLNIKSLSYKKLSINLPILLLIEGVYYIGQIKHIEKEYVYFNVYTTKGFLIPPSINDLNEFSSFGIKRFSFKNKELENRVKVFPLSKEIFVKALTLYKEELFKTLVPLTVEIRSLIKEISSQK